MTCVEVKDQAEIRDILDNIHYEGWTFHVGDVHGSMYLQVRFRAADNDGKPGEPTEQAGRKWALSRHMTKSEIVQTVFKAVLTAEEHEIRERFSYNGRPIFGPHFDVDVLVKLCDAERLDVRPPMPAVGLSPGMVGKLADAGAAFERDTMSFTEGSD